MSTAQAGSPKQAIHALVDALPDSELQAAQRYLEYLRDTGNEHPLLRALRNAPLDDEPYTDEERAAVAEARAEMGAGKGIPHEEVKRMFGLA
jgi:hypothetical protein